MKQYRIRRIIMLLVLICLMTGCSGSMQETEQSIEYADEMLPIERERIVIGKLSTEHKSYSEMMLQYPDCVDYIQEISMYDKEINDTFVIHLSLPPDYDAAVNYPMVVMTDGIWRLKEHARYRDAMRDGELEKLIMVSIGYPDSYDAGEMRKREFLYEPESFLHFIVDNLVPYLEETCSVDEENLMLTGHSYGGYFAYHALFYRDTLAKNTFRNFYIGSTSVPNETAMEKIFAMEEDYAMRNSDMDCNVYVSIGSLEGLSYQLFQETMEQKLRERNYPELNYTAEILEGYTHEKVCGPSSKIAVYQFYGTDQPE